MYIEHNIIYQAYISRDDRIYHTYYIIALYKLIYVGPLKGAKVGVQSKVVSRIASLRRLQHILYTLTPGDQT